MGEIRNLTDANVSELEEKLDELQKENPDIEYRFFRQDDPKETLTESEVKARLDEINAKLGTLIDRFNLVFGNHFLIDGRWERVE